MNEQKTAHSLKFEKALEDNDYGLILGADGSLKGIWVPDHLWDEPFPLAITALCKAFYGIDPNDSNEDVPESSSNKLH